MRHCIRLGLLLLQPAAALVFGALPAVAQEPPAAAGRQTLAAVRSQAAPVKPAKPVKPVPDTRRWDIEFHRGFGFGGTSAGGTGTLPPPGDAFDTAGGSPSRRVPSWNFGDGAALLNDVLASYGRPERLRPLDDVLTRQAVEHQIGDGFGARVTRTLTPRLTLEVGFEYAATTFTVLPATLDGLQATTDSFLTAFSGLVATGQGAAFTNPSLSAGFTAIDGSGSEILVTGAVIAGRRAGRLRPYVAAGGGLVSATGEAVLTLTGRYAFGLPSGARVDETDSVTVRLAGGRGLVVLAGGGLSVGLSGASGIRVDGRVHVVQHHVNTIVDSQPSAVPSLPADAIWSNLTPGIQFVTNPSTGLASNLTSPGLSGFHTLKGSGFHTRLSLAVGYFWRF